MDFAAIKQVLADVDAAADKGVENSKRNAEVIHRVVSEAYVLVTQLEQSGAVVNLVTQFKTLFNNVKTQSTAKTEKSPHLSMAEFLAKNTDAWKNLNRDQIVNMARQFPESVERLYNEYKAAQEKGGTDGSSQDSPYDQP
ncbi:MAG TPA: hypothetical protein VMR98_00780 [Candidatus Polarisedimenticolaceae bacterium]|nr:hypothetical protein [Candidatus Polarisedimenticolaceae bacterium]